MIIPIAKNPYDEDPSKAKGKPGINPNVVRAKAINKKNPFAKVTTNDDEEASAKTTKMMTRNELYANKRRVDINQNPKAFRGAGK